MAEPRHIAQQAVGKQDLAHMKQDDDDRREAAAERAADQFGDVQVSPDVYPDYSGDTSLDGRDAKDLRPPHGKGYRETATSG